MLVKEVFAQFLSDQTKSLSKKVFQDYESVIELFGHQLDSFGWDDIEDGDEAYDKAQKQKKSFIDFYDHTYIESNVEEFLDYFVTRKVMAGDEFTLKVCPRVIRKLLKWMRDKKLVDLTNEEIKDMCENQSWEDTMKEIDDFL